MAWCFDNEEPKPFKGKYRGGVHVAGLGTFREHPEGSPTGIHIPANCEDAPIVAALEAKMNAQRERIRADFEAILKYTTGLGVSMTTVGKLGPTPTTRPTLASMVRIPSPTQTSLSVLLKGVSGSGKTRTALSFPEPILVLYADVNRETVRVMAKGGTDLKTIPIESWSQYENQIIPPIAERKLGITNEDGTPWEPRTIVLDTFDFLSDLMWREIQGSRDQLQIPDYGKGLRRMANTTRELIYSTTPRDGHPGYHVVVCSHVKDITDDGGNLVKVSPAVMGQFKDQIEDYFDYVLLCDSEVASKVEGTKVTKARRFKIHAAPPNRYHTCKGGSLPTELDIPEGDSAFAVLNTHLGISTNEE